MSMVRFLTPRPFFGSNRRLSSTSSQNGILRVPWPSIFNFLPKRSLNRRKPPRNDRGRGLSYTRCFASLGARLLSLALEAGLSLPPAKKRPFFNQRSIYWFRSPIRNTADTTQRAVTRIRDTGHMAGSIRTCCVFPVSWPARLSRAV